MQNSFIESFNGRLRDELLNETLFTSLAQARVVLRCWRADYNGSRPHSQLGWKTSSEFGAYSLFGNVVTLDPDTTRQISCRYSFDFSDLKLQGCAYEGQWKAEKPSQTSRPLWRHPPRS
jgi:hypothetical protein